ncbi:sporulation protein YunB [Neobacillus sp. PS3-40]|uniref:sporulation protein YunB n=1 Tax=Neobacillus sp. PS3-40 TaxID=3070679 RepID=UPI0027E13E80|nr:sporulation protein YunB [Neobacillus sp. PS3-40]WML45899.1 sporulation protein YunB [Neobacillus sp. PS3-40]
MAKFRRKHVSFGLPFRYVLLISLVFFIFSTAAGLWLVNKAIEPTLMKYAETQTRKIASLVINDAIDKKTTNVDDISNVIEIKTKGKISSVQLKTSVINRALADTVAEIQKNIDEVEKGSFPSLSQVTDVEIEKNNKLSDGFIIWYVPLGQATKNALFGNLGPKIPIKFNAIGDIRPDVRMKATPMGINNTWIDASLHLVVSVQIITPFTTKITKLTENIPIAAGLIQGDVPQYFNGGSGSSPAIQLPDKKNK